MNSFWVKSFFPFCSCFSQMSIFMSQGLWEMLPRVTRGQSLPSYIPGELSMSARGQCLAGRIQSLLSLHALVCMPFEVKENSVLSSALWNANSRWAVHTCFCMCFCIKTDADYRKQNKPNKKAPESCKEFWDFETSWDSIFSSLNFWIRPFFFCHISTQTSVTSGLTCFRICVAFVFGNGKDRKQWA